MKKAILITTVALIFYILVSLFGQNISKFFLIVLGFIFVMLFARLIPGLLLEIIFFGGIFGFIESWRFWGTQIGMPELGTTLLIMSSAAFMFWAIIRLVYVMGLLWFPPLTSISKLLLGS